MTSPFAQTAQPIIAAHVFFGCDLFEVAWSVVGCAAVDVVNLHTLFDGSYPREIHQDVHV